ncbi:MAG: OadG family protein [Oscillibacter sp.]|jgi:sodium pump decarboxylase gamma subunit|nr:OadG family protein [Oscillibacter sp.]
MIHGSMSMGTAGIVCIVSMLIVFAVLLILYAATMIMGSVLGKVTKKPAAAPKAAAPKAAAAPAAPKQDDGELLAILAAAVAAIEGSGNPMVRNREDLD